MKSGMGKDNGERRGGTEESKDDSPLATLESATAFRSVTLHYSETTNVFRIKSVTLTKCCFSLFLGSLLKINVYAHHVRRAAYIAIPRMISN